MSAQDFNLQDISISFGGLRAVSRFSMNVPAHSLWGVIGPNGAGKTTLFNVMTGVYHPDSGDLSVGGKSLIGLPPYEIARLGIARTFQNVRIFNQLSVLDNVLVSFEMRSPYGYFDAILRTKKFRIKELELREKANEYLKLLGLAKASDELAVNLPYGDQKKLEIARALAAQPLVLLLDEPAAGLNSQEKVELMNAISNIRSRYEVSVLLIEHDMKMVMGICEHIVVLDHGEKIAEGTPKEIQGNSKVIEAYLGAT